MKPSLYLWINKDFSQLAQDVIGGAIIDFNQQTNHSVLVIPFDSKSSPPSPVVAIEKNTLVLPKGKLSPEWTQIFKDCVPLEPAKDYYRATGDNSISLFLTFLRKRMESEGCSPEACIPGPLLARQ